MSLSDLRKSKNLVANDTNSETSSPAKKRISSNLMYGRKQLIRQLPLYKGKSARILEVGCETGYMLQAIAKQYATVELMGIDQTDITVNQSILATKAYQDRVQVEKIDYDYQNLPETASDIAVLSYSLSQAKDWENLIQKTYENIRSNGYIAVVDFHQSKLGTFQERMAKKAVHMDGTLLPLLRKYFTEHYQYVTAARLGMWEYFVFIGRKDA